MEGFAIETRKHVLPQSALLATEDGWCCDPPEI